jgi:ataxia telangiectasia mutated family protein
MFSYSLITGNPRLNGQDVVSHVLKIMSDPFTKSAFGLDHTSLLLKDILCVRKYWCEISQATWQGKYKSFVDLSPRILY